MGCIVKDGGKIQGYAKNHSLGLWFLVVIILSGVGAYYESKRPSPTPEYNVGDIVKFRGDPTLGGVVRSTLCPKGASRCTYVISFRDNGSVSRYTAFDFELQPN